MLCAGDSLKKFDLLFNFSCPVQVGLLEAEEVHV